MMYLIKILQKNTVNIVWKQIFFWNENHLQRNNYINKAQTVNYLKTLKIQS